MHSTSFVSLWTKGMLLSLLLLVFSKSVFSQDKTADSNTSEYLVGTGIGDFTRLLNGKLPHRVGTYGYVHYKEPYDSTRNDTARGIVNGVHINLMSRVITIRHRASNELFVYVLMDLAFPSENLRRGIMEKMAEIDPDFNSSNLLLAATHTHSAPGGHSAYVGYEVATPGCRPDIVETIVHHTYEAIREALGNEAPTQLVFNESIVPDSIPIAFSRRALPAYNLNPEITEPISEEENYKATDRIWQMISFQREGKLHSMLNLFGAHPNRLGSSVLSADTRGAASALTEGKLPPDGVAIFAQNAPGDIDDEGSYRRKVSTSNKNVFHPAYYSVDEKGHYHHSHLREKRVWIEGEFLKRQAFRTHEEPETQFEITGEIDCELIYVDMSKQDVPSGNYAHSLDPQDYYMNDYFLFGGWGHLGALIRPKSHIARTGPPTIGLGAIARIPDKLTKVVIGLERSLRYVRLLTAPFKRRKKSRYLWHMYRSQAEKTVMLEGNEFPSAVGFRIGSPAFNAFAKFDPVLKELTRDRKIGLHNEHTMYPSIVPIQIIIIGNIAIAGVSGEPGNIAGQRIERAIYAQLKRRGIKRVIVNGYANENTGYIFTPEEYTSQFSPSQCGFVLYGRWTCPAFRYRFEKLAEAMLSPKAERGEWLDYSIQPPVFSKEWCEKASNLEFLKLD